MFYNKKAQRVKPGESSFRCIKHYPYCSRQYKICLDYNPLHHIVDLPPSLKAHAVHASKSYIIRSWVSTKQLQK